MDSCPICKKPVAPRAENPSHPFCSARCKTVDLGKWLNEEYRVPVQEDPDDGIVSARSPSGHAGEIQENPEEKA